MKTKGSDDLMCPLCEGNAKVNVVLALFSVRHIKPIYSIGCYRIGTLIGH